MATTEESSQPQCDRMTAFTEKRIEDPSPELTFSQLPAQDDVMNTAVGFRNIRNP